MKLSEAMMLGSSLVKMEAGNWNTCALGVAGSAAGIRLYEDGYVDGERESVDQRQTPICRQWPWLNDPDADNKQFKANIWDCFDDLVCMGHMTFEHLVDYVRSIEPACGECNRFACVCQKQRAEQPVSEAVTQ